MSELSRFAFSVSALSLLFYLKLTFFHFSFSVFFLSSVSLRDPPPRLSPRLRLRQPVDDTHPMPHFLGAPGDLPPPPSSPPSHLERKRGKKEETSRGRGGGGGGAKKGSSDESAASLAARLLASSSCSSSNSSSSSFASLPRSVGSAAWSRAHALIEELNARAHADAQQSQAQAQPSEGREEAVPLALSAGGVGTPDGAPPPLSAVAAHLLVASSWRARALPSILRSLLEERIESGSGSGSGSEGKGKKEKEERKGRGDWFLSLYGLMRHDVSCANLLAVALSAPAPARPRFPPTVGTAATAAPPFSDDGRFSVPLPPSPPPAIRALCDDSETVACALAAWAARSVRWWDAAEGGRAAAARTAEAATKTAAAAAAKTAAAKAGSFSPSLAADETALAAAASALAVFRCLAQHAEDLPPGVGAVLAGGGAGDLVPVLVSWKFFSIFFRI